MNKLFLLFAFATLSCVIACGPESHKNVESSVQPPQIQMPEVPALLKDKELSNWLAIHYWDKINPSDTAFKVYPEVLDNVVFNWSMVLRDASFASAKAGINNLFEKVKADSATVSKLMFSIEKSTYNPELDIRNFEAYISVLEWIVKYDKFSEVDKLRPNSQLQMAIKNRVGVQANDFEFITLDNKTYKLSNLYGPYVLIFINTPGCSACKEYKDILSNNDIMNRMVDCNALQVIGIVPDDVENEWRAKADQLPKNWVNGFDKNQQIRANKSYDLSVVPSLILLDRDKRVLLKDVNPNVLLDYLSKL